MIIERIVKKRKQARARLKVEELKMDSKKGRKEFLLY